MKKIYAIIICLIFIIVFLFLYKKYTLNINEIFKTEDKKNILDTRNSNPEYAQNIFLSDVSENKNNESTKSAIYWVSHRYAENGGDPYEIYNYIENNQKVLSFMKEAEQIYPDVFKKLANREVKNKSFESTLVDLAYKEIIDKYGYSDMAIQSHLALGYIISYNNFKEEIYKEKSIYYFNKAEPSLVKIYNNSNNGIDKNNFIVGLNHFNSSSAYYDNLNLEYKSRYSREEIFNYLKVLSRDTKLETMVKYSYLRTYILANNLKDISPEDIEELTSNLILLDSTFSIVKKIIEDKENKLSFFYKDYIIPIGKRSPIFVNWLVGLNGTSYVQSDFK